MYDYDNTKQQKVQMELNFEKLNGLVPAIIQDDCTGKVLMLGFWWLLSPGFAIFATVLAFNLLGDVLRDIADPKKEI